MNNWMSEPFRYPEKPMDRGKVLSKEDLERLGAFARYKDVDGDGIGWRTLPGTDHPAAAYFTRGSGHNALAQYSERSDDYQQNLDRLKRKFETAKGYVPQPIIEGNGAKVGLLAYGTTHWAMVECRDQLRDEHGLETDYLRVRAFPFSGEVEDFIRRHERVYVVEQNRDGQLFDLLKIELPVELISRIHSLAHIDGLPVDARTITDEIMQKESK
jgi:2-oxoglutarate ferredoxin oxidoreductase subunit alpha